MFDSIRTRETKETAIDLVNGRTTRGLRGSLLPRAARHINSQKLGLHRLDADAAGDWYRSFAARPMDRHSPRRVLASSSSGHGRGSTRSWG
jgi:hypothetical protein